MSSYPARLLLVRHGETDWNQAKIPQGHADIPLNNKGREQARALAQRLRGWDIDCIYSSDLARASETAAILGNAVGLGPRLVSAWREVDLGGWSGLTHAEIEDRYPHELAALAQGRDIPRGGGETLAALQARAVQEFESLRVSHAAQTVLIVSHGGTLKTLICHLIGLGLRHHNRLSTGGNTGLSIVQFDSGSPRLTLLNDASHLSDCH